MATSRHGSSFSKPSGEQRADDVLHQPALRRAIVGAVRGLKVVTTFFVVTLIGWVLTLGHLLDSRHLTLVGIAGMYFAWGLLGGAMGGLLSPLVRSKLSAIPVVACVFLPLAVAVRVLEAGWLGWTTRDAGAVLFVASLMGVLWGPLVWKEVHQETARPPTKSIQQNRRMKVQ